MEPIRFFYSKDGTDSHGPVTEEELRQLVAGRVVGMSSFLYREGETTWRPFDPEGFKPPIQIPRLPLYEPPPYVPTRQAKAKVEALVEQLVAKNDEGPFAPALKLACPVFAAAVSVLLAILQGDEFGIGASFAATLLFVGFFPFAISRLFPLVWRMRACAIGMVVLATIAFFGQSQINNIRQMEASLDSAAAAVKKDAATPMASKGSDFGTIPPASSNLSKPAEVAVQDDAETSEMLHAVARVSQVMVAKVKVSQASEDACGSFDPARLGTLADLNTLRQGIAKLRETQVDVLTYFQDYDNHCRSALADGTFRADHVTRFIANAREQGHIDQAIAIWQLKIKLSDDHLARLDFLDKHWGSWRPQDGKLIFDRQDDLTSYNALTQSLIDDVKTGHDLQNPAPH